MKIFPHISLQTFNTFGIDVQADYLVEYNSVEDLQTVLQSNLVQSNRVLHIGGGSNLLFLSDFKGVVLHSAIRYTTITNDLPDSVYLEVGAGVVWDDLVVYAVNNNWGGIENLSCIPGEVGAAAVQNIGAYGTEVKDSIVAVHAVNINTGKISIFSLSDCCYAYRSSIFKSTLQGEYIITSVVFRLDKSPMYKLHYQNLEEAVKKNGVINLQNIRNTIASLRSQKLPDYKIYGNAGSFFMNPTITREKYLSLQKKYPALPHYQLSATEEKIPAGWLIEQCGWKGKQLGKVAVHATHALVLINMGGAKGVEVLHLATKIQDSVQETFGIQLQPEVNYISS